ncbi:hypothetical protein [Arenibaculum sp.]|jgi:hypothetical protein|uniref:hypothetical protein n=1 Tax=Arenibaculum sp. TaxID=2865862 RepID=UPI002E15BF83|nr:hypothetical protein [Arenibaculum sp.]
MTASSHLKLVASAAERAAEDAEDAVNSLPIDVGGSGPHDPGMETRVARLEVEFERVRKDLDEIKTDLRTLVLNTTALPTKRDLTNNTFAGLGIGLALMALIIGGIIGGLSWIRAEPSPVAFQPPVTITAPPAQVIIVPPGAAPAELGPAGPQPE